MADAKQIGDNIKKFREAKGLTQEKLGAAAGGRSVNQMNGYERGRSRPSPPILKIIAEALGVSVADLTEEPVDQHMTSDGVAETINQLRIKVAASLGVPVSSATVSIHIAT